jgi:hypothetical protein
MAARQEAKNLLNHYLQRALKNTGSKVDSDTTVEIDAIVDHIVDAAVEETLQRLDQRVMDALHHGGK